MIDINLDKCVGCGMCESDCLVNAIRVKEDKAKVKNILCINCGHCMAICPTDAIEMQGFDKNEVLEFNHENFDLEPEKLLNFIKFRRSIRSYKDIEVEEEKIKNIVEAGRYTPTGGNRQPIRYILVKEKLKEVKELAIEGLYNLALNTDDEDYVRSIYKNTFKRMHKRYKEEGYDSLFYDAPLLMVVVGDTSLGGSVYVDGGLAASNMELMAYSQGLGMCYNGFFVMASNVEPKLKELLGMNDNEAVITSFILGYPSVKYKRTVNRNSAKFEIR